MNRPAGASARAEHERLRRLRLSRLRERCWAVMAAAAIAFGCGYFVVAVLPGAAFAVFEPIVPGIAEKAPQVPVGLGVSLGLLLAFTSTWSLTRPQMGESAWKKGAMGEELVGRRLDSLRSQGVAVVHDVPFPGSRANIDHVVVSPHGVFTIETKAYRGRLEVRNRGTQLWVAGRDRSNLLAQALRQAEAVRDALSRAGLGHVPVAPILCFVGTQVSPFARRNAGGVELTTLRRLPQLILSSAGPSVEPGDIESVARFVASGWGGGALLENQSSRSAEELGSPGVACRRCGKAMVERTRRKDGVAFYGCSGFPACRYTQPVEASSD